MKRFYKSAATGSVGEAYAVLLDGRTIRTPAKAEMLLESPLMAEAIAREWDRQEGEVLPQSMPLMQFAATAIDRVGPQREKVIDDIASYGASDMICYRAEYPEDLVRRQQASWDPMIDWAKQSLNAELKVTAGIQHIEQPAPALTQLRRHVEQCSDLELAALYSMTSLSGSLVVALAIRAGRITADEAFDISELDATHVIERWGEDNEASERRQNIKQGLRAGEEFLTLCRGK